jgi:polyferredoxin
MRRPDRSHTLAIVAGLVFGIVVLVLVLPPVIRFIAFLFSGDSWRALLGAGLLSFIAGLGLGAALGFFEQRRRGGEREESLPRRSRGPLWTLVWILFAFAPVCVLVALVGSGWLQNTIEWSGDRISEIRSAQDSS